MTQKVGDIAITSENIKRAVAARAEGQNYVGLDDKMLDFGQAQSFLDEKSSEKRFTLKMKNTSATDTVYVQFNEILSGIQNGCNLLADGTIAETLSVTGTPNKADLLAKYLKSHASRLVFAKFNVDDAEQLDEPLKLYTETPFGTHSERQRVPSEEQSQGTNNPKMSEIKDFANWILSDKSTILYGVRPGRTVNLTLIFGASVDNAYYLNSKADEAAVNAAAAYSRAKGK